jgi:putative endonuclease
MEQRALALKGAKQYLRSNGIEVIDESYSCDAGEIDIIFKDGNDLVFASVESSSSLILPDETITDSHRVKLELIAVNYLVSHDMPSCRLRFDVLSITQVIDGKALLCHHRDALSAPSERSLDRTAEAKKILGDRQSRPKTPDRQPKQKKAKEQGR